MGHYAVQGHSMSFKVGDVATDQKPVSDVLLLILTDILSRRPTVRKLSQINVQLIFRLMFHALITRPIMS